MLIYSETQERWRGEPINGIRHPRNIEKLWSDAELAAIGLEKYVPPVEPPQEPSPRRVGTYTELMDKFTQQEKMAILAAAKQSPELELILMQATASNRVALDSELLAQNLAALVQAGVISQERVDGVLGGSFE